MTMIITLPPCDVNEPKAIELIIPTLYGGAHSSCGVYLTDQQVRSLVALLPLKFKP